MRRARGTTVEVLTPDFLRKEGAIETVMAAQPGSVQPQSGNRAAALSDDPARRALFRVAAPAGTGQGTRCPTGFTKSGLMVGLGESREEIMQVMDDLRAREGGFPHHRPVSAAHPQARQRWSASGRRRNSPAWNDGARQRLSDGVGLAPDAFLLSRRQRFRGAEGWPKRSRSQRDRRIVRDPHRSVSRPISCMRWWRMWRQYPEFLPWVVALRVLSRREKRPRLLAEMAVGYRALRERYTSDVMLDPSRHRIDVVDQTQGPVQELENHWRFTPEKMERTRRAARWNFPSPSNSRAGCCMAWRAVPLKKSCSKWPTLSRPGPPQLSPLQFLSL